MLGLLRSAAKQPVLTGRRLPMRRLVFSALFVALALLLLSAYPVLGQVTPLEPGTRLRVHAHGLQLSGEFLRWDGDTLVVRPESAGPVVRTDRATAASAIQRIERGVPRSPGRGAARGALWGGIFGGVAGVTLGAATAGDCIACAN